MQPVTLSIVGPPVGKGRPRFSRRSGVAFTPTPTRNAEAYVRLLATEAMAGQPAIEGPVDVKLAVICAVPKSWSKRRQAAALCNLTRPSGRPDLDNVLKLLTDAMNGVVYRDDAQIVHLSASKRYGPQPMTVVTVTPLAVSEAA